MEWYSTSPEETLAIGQNIGKQLKPGTIVCFFGELGAGKTTLIKGIAQEARGLALEQQDLSGVTSPTFTYLNIYQGSIPVYHFDLYRLKDSDEFLSMGFEEFLYAEGICCIEWSEKIAPLIPQEAIQIVLSHEGGDARLIQTRPENAI